MKNICHSYPTNTLHFFQGNNNTFSFLTSCFRIAESRLKHNALQHGPRLLRRLALSSFRSNAAILRAPNSFSKRLSASFKKKKAFSFPKIEKCYQLLGWIFHKVYTSSKLPKLVKIIYIFSTRVIRPVVLLLVWNKNKYSDSHFKLKI